VFVTPTERAIATSRHSSEDNTETYPREIVWERVERNNLPQDDQWQNLLNTVMNFRVT
jgi:hypothetical protein